MEFRGGKKLTSIHKAIDRGKVRLPVCVWEGGGREGYRVGRGKNSGRLDTFSGD